AVFDIRDGISEEEIKVRIERVRGLVSTIMYQKAGISNLLVEESYLPLKNSLLELLNKTLSEISRFLKKFTILLEIDQEDMPEDRRIKIEFDPEVEGEASLFGRQLAKSEWKYKNDKSL
ncbi:MAG: hypothetical protein U9N73_02550, partial [Candidatus Auribacterota bacterium]|nr:hypothetical protein [Candidatus Auribacterota bacterium]